MSRPKLPAYQRKKNSTGGYYGRPFPPQCPSIMEMATTNLLLTNLPKGTVPLDNQVAGHTFQPGTNEVGLLKENDGTILKPCTKALCGAREIRFYENIQDSQEPSVVALKDNVPEYRGTTKLYIGTREIEFIKLVNLSDGMLEPCIMDIKIGKRTWDPLATSEKRAAEEQKYLACKQNLGLCIPGFQVHSVTTGKIKRYGKDYGKKLNEKTIKDAIRVYLNADAGLCRALLMQLLSGLWAIQKWARTQKTLRLYSSSVLLLYDARRLRANLQTHKRKISAGSLPSPAVPINPSKTPQTAESNGTTSPFTWNTNNSNAQVEPIESYRKVQRSHSAQNNYDEDLKAMREEYVFMLDNLIGANRNKEWALVKMIDFAHVFPADEDTIDNNYLFGIDNLVKIFEELLKESELN